MGIDDFQPLLSKQLQKWQQTYYLDDDTLLIVARHYTWKEDLMIEWFQRTEQDEYKMGIKVRNQTNRALQNDDLCPSCYEQMTQHEALACGHSFCEDCWRQFLVTEVFQGTKALN